MQDKLYNQGKYNINISIPENDFYYLVKLYEENGSYGNCSDEVAASIATAFIITKHQNMVSAIDALESVNERLIDMNNMLVEFNTRLLNVLKSVKKIYKFRLIIGS